MRPEPNAPSTTHQGSRGKSQCTFTFKNHRSKRERRAVVPYLFNGRRELQMKTFIFRFFVLLVHHTYPLPVQCNLIVSSLTLRFF
mmetsp:Transcript_35669/g.92972  ORF Transcript_35669/g.92972 Transcript_35669/m.92972 type:complete len:85 (-) Transcript_35669:355-609(-)